MKNLVYLFLLITQVFFSQTGFENGNTLYKQGNYQEAIDAYAANDFDFGFFDVMMPVKNGVESFLEIRKFNPTAKVYFMTGYSDGELLDAARKGGALGVFSKPTDPERLLNILDHEAA